MAESGKRRKLSWRRKIFRIGIVIGLIGLVLIFLLPQMYNSAIRSQVKLIKDSEIYKNWLNFPVPLKSTFHFFHVLNPDEVINGAKPQLEEVGPFVFEQWRAKEVVEWGQNGETVKYYEKKKYLYKPEDSADWDMDIVTINPIVVGVASNLDEIMKTIPVAPKVFSPFLYTMISAVLMSHGQSMFLKTTPRQLLLGHKINIFETVDTIVEPLSTFGVKKEDLVPTEEIPNNAFGILNGKNGTKSGPFEIYTGKVDQSKYGYMVSYKDSPKMYKFEDEKCDQIYGTDGAQFPPFRSKRDKLPIFTPDLCRPLVLVYDSETEFKGIPVWKMKLDPKIFESSKTNAANRCYCVHWKKRPDRCSIRGTIDLSGCLNGAPLVLSAPHFMDTSPPLYETMVDGLKPDREKHEFSVMFESRIGSPIYAFARMQLNVRVERTAFLQGFNSVRNTLIPLVWIEESAGVDDFLAMMLRIILVYIMNGSQTLALIMFVAGFLAAILAFTYGIYCSKSNEDSLEHLYTSRSKIPHIDSDREEEEEADQVDDPESRKKKTEAKSNNLRYNLNLAVEGNDSKDRTSRVVRGSRKNHAAKSSIAAISSSKGENSRPSGLWQPFYSKTRTQTRKVVTSMSQSLMTRRQVTSEPRLKSINNRAMNHAMPSMEPLLDASAPVPTLERPGNQVTAITSTSSISTSMIQQSSSTSRVSS